MFSEPAQPYTILDEMFFISSVTVYQQAVLAGTKCSSKQFAWLSTLPDDTCWGSPQTPWNAEVPSAAARFCGTLFYFRTSEKHAKDRCGIRPLACFFYRFCWRFCVQRYCSHQQAGLIFRQKPERLQAMMDIFTFGYDHAGFYAGLCALCFTLRVPD